MKSGSRFARAVTTSSLMPLTRSAECRAGQSPPLHDLYSAHFFALALQVDDDVRDRDREALARS
jgi:hypothetical protein